MKITNLNLFAEHILTAVALTLFTVGCNDADFSGNTGTSPEKPGEPIAEAVSVSVNKIGEGTGIADIIFLLDTSTSMESERQRLEENMALFLAKFEAGSGIIDYQVIIIGQGFTFPQIANGKYEVVERQVDSYDALNVLQAFLKAPNLKKLKLRPEAVTEVVVVTDDNARMSPRVFEAWLLQNAGTIGRVHINGFVGLPKSKQNSWCQIASPGSAYRDLAASSNVGGLVQDLCVEDWGQLLSALADQIIVNDVTTEFVLSKEIDPSGTVIVLVNGQVIDPSHLRIDYETNSVFLDGSVTPKTGDKVSVKYIAN